MSRSLCSSLVVAVFSVLTVGTAAAQPAPPAPGTARDGLFIGFTLGGGELSCEDTSAAGDGPCDGVTEGGSISFDVGAMLSPRFAIAGEVWVMAHTEDRLTISHTIVTANAKWWALPRLWLKAGIGAAHARLTYDGIINLTDRTDSVPAVMVGAGYEVLVGRSFALDIQFRAGTGFYKDEQTQTHSVAIGAGLHWY